MQSILVFRPSVLAWAGLCALTGIAQAQNSTLAPVTVTANPLGSPEVIAPVTTLQQPELLQRQGTTLGSTLEGLPGISSSHFGPNVGRPVIRGLDGDRVRILNNGAPVADLSNLSPDHAVGLDPLVIERVEVLRGPGTLLYGGNAVGGVVNVIDNRIPREPLFDERGGVSGRAQLGAATVNREQSGAAVVEAGNHRYALHADVMSRHTGDVSAPVALNCTRGGVTTSARRICNSASDAWGGSLGGSLLWDHGYLGASMSTQGNRYGTVAEDEVLIDMKSSRWAVEGEQRNLKGWLQSIRAQVSRTEYMHTEIEGSEPKTVFRSTTNDVRLQARHARLGPLDGVIGLQIEAHDFTADGAEAFAPFSRTSQSAVFAHEELARSWGKLSFGARMESVRVESLGNPLVAGFIVGSRSFAPRSAAVGALWNVAPQWQLTSNLSANERAPRDYELFANGDHVATNAREVGNAELGMERSANLDVGATWKSGPHRAQVQAFMHQFSNFISLEQADATTTPPTYNFTQVQARFTGLEASSTVRLLERPGKLDLSLRADTVRADNTSTGEPLPRIAPLRLWATLIWAEGPWSARFGVDQWAAQSRVPAGQAATGGYTLWHAAATYRQKMRNSQVLWFARLENIGNSLAYPATSILTQTAPGRAPLPGQNFRVGWQLSF